MFQRLLRLLCASTVAVALLAIALLPSGSAQDRNLSGYSKEIKDRLKEWESDKDLKKYAYTRTTPDVSTTPGAQTPAAGTGKDNALAICIGLNLVDPKHYQGWDGELGACENDANAMEKLLTDQKFKVKKLLSDAATADAVLGEIRRAAQELKPGGLLVITYSGHGSQARDRNGDEPEDRMDETWCLFDRMLIDDELAQEWTRFAENTRILVLSDSCHSGSATKAIKEHEKLFEPPKEATAAEKAALKEEFAKLKDGAPLKKGTRGYIRSVPSTVRSKTLQNKANHVVYSQVGKDTPTPQESDKRTKASVLLISGCDDDEVSLEIGKHGLFTKALLDVWQDGKFTKSHQVLRDDIFAKIRNNQTPQFFPSGVKNPAFEGQRPFAP